jgi:hypothetical protein
VYRPGRIVPGRLFTPTALESDLPNIDPQDITIEMRGEEIQISGRHQDRQHTGAVRQQNRPTGDFEFLIDLPSDIDPNKVDASHDCGVLTISVAKKRDLQPRRIEIHAGERSVKVTDRFRLDLAIRRALRSASAAGSVPRQPLGRGGLGRGQSGVSRCRPRLRRLPRRPRRAAGRAVADRHGRGERGRREEQRQRSSAAPSTPRPLCRRWAR